MTVAELIEILSHYPPDSQVYDIDGMTVISTIPNKNTPVEDEWILREKYDWADLPRPGRQSAPAQDECPVDVCPACGYAGAMGLNLMHPATGPVTWLRCHRCGADRALPDLPGETP